MAKLDETGIYQLKNGNWAYRYTRIINGKSVSRKKTKDEFGKPLKTKTEAAKARKASILKDSLDCMPRAPHEFMESVQPLERKTVAEVYAEYCKHGRNGKSYNTIKKQDSL